MSEQENRQTTGQLQDEMQEEQKMPTRWYCDTDCRASNRACRGESGKDPTAKNLCPYFEDMLF